MSEYIAQGTSLTAVANKIREKTGDSAPLEFPDDFIAGIDEFTEPPQMPVDSILFYSRTEFTLGIENKTKNWDGSLYYSTDNNIWIEWSGTTDISSSLYKGYHRIYLRGVGNTHITRGVIQAGDDAFRIYGFAVRCIGNLNKLLSYDTDIEVLTAAYSYCFNYLFYECSNLDFNVQLPSTTISQYCYAHMFDGCRSMLKAPDLPATTLAGNCYEYMFQNCKLLKQAPTLPATILTNSCYYAMFAFTAIEEPPDLPATELTQSCYCQMFKNCKHLTKAPALPATTLATNCYNNMFANCSLISELPELPAQTLMTGCYNNMFIYATSIKLSTTQVDEYQTEFRIPSTETGTDATNALQNMFAYTGGSFKGTPTINTTYYTSNTIVPAT